VPPPPVTGAATGTGLAAEVAVTVAVGVTVRVARGVTVAVGLEVTPGVPEVVVLSPGDGVLPALPAEAEALIEPLAEILTVGEKTEGDGVVDDAEVHAVSATGASRVSAPQHKAVSFTPNVVPCTFMDPPCAWLMTTVFPVPGSRNRRR
jgi:hypothetical protein